VPLKKGRKKERKVKKERKGGNNIRSKYRN
jgi:hypothetical protein